MERDTYSDNLPDDFQKVNDGVPGQIGQGQVNPDQTEKDAQAKEAEQVHNTPKKSVKKGRK